MTTGYGTISQLRTALYLSVDGDSGGAVNGFVLWSTDVPAAGGHKGSLVDGRRAYSFMMNIRLELGATGIPGLAVRRWWE